MRPLVRISNLAKRFGVKEVLCQISLDVDPSEVVCLIGPSGSGKTTLLRCISHLEPIDAGRIEVDGELIGYREDAGGALRERSEREIAQRRARIGFVFQRFNLWPHKTALGNVAEAPIRVLGESRSDAEANAEQLLERVGLADKRNAYPGSLSGGQQQRVAIARALAMSPKLMLFDEPTSALDPETVGEVLAVMGELAADGMTMICATHELGFAREAADRIVMVDHGRVVEVAPPEEFFESPRSQRTRRFLSKIL
jgi:polar amino acid transport system ATP-binding protein